MAKLYRYMSIYEFLKMSIGNKIQPLSDYSKTKKTSSKGICFLGEKSFDSDDYFRETPESCRSFLGGIVSKDILVEFELENPEDITESFGVYDTVGKIPEYWLESYDKNKITPLRYKIAKGSSFEEDEWEEYNDKNIDKNPKDLLKRIVDKRHSEFRPSIDTLEDWCSEFSAICPGNDGWYVERNEKDKTLKLSYGNLYSIDSNHEKFSLSFKQESTLQACHPTSGREFETGNYTFEVSGDIPQSWETLVKDFEELTEKQTTSSKAHISNTPIGRINDNEFSQLNKHSRIIALCEYAILKEMFPDLMNQYRLDFVPSNPNTIFETVGIEAHSGEKSTSVAEFNTLNIHGENGDVEYSVHNVGTNEILFRTPAKFKSVSELGKETLEEQPDILSKDEIFHKLFNRSKEIETEKDESYQGEKDD